MRIAIFSDTYMPYINGVATSSYILRNELMKLGHEVVVVTSELPSDSEYDEDDELVLRVPGLELQVLYGYRACSVYSFKGMREIKRLNIDVIHVQTEFGIGIFGRIAGEALNVPVVYTYHTMWIDYSHYVNPANLKTVDSVVKKAIARVSKFYGDNCTELIVPSLKTKEALETYGLKNKNIYIIPTGLELETFNPANKNQLEIEKIKKQYNLDDKFVITFLGRIAPEKSIEVVIEAIKEVVKKKSNVVCLIVGGGPQLDELKELVKKDEIEDFIIFTGPQPAPMVPSFYHVSNLFVSASISETQGLTYIEAMASGVPVIARHDDQLEDIIDDKVNGFFFYQPDELSNLLLDVMSRNLDSVKEKAFEKSQGFSSKVFAKKVLEVYENAIQSKLYTYKINSIIPTKNNKNEVIFIIDNVSVSLELTDNIIEEYNLEIDRVIDREEFDALKDLEQVSRAYNKALKYLSYKDYTYSQLHKKLMDSGDYDDTQLDATMQLLVEKNLINDEIYTINYLKRCTKLGIGLNKAIYNLRSNGIDGDLIDSCLEELNDDEEYNGAKHVIETYYKNNLTALSHKAILNKIRQKLFIKGFTSETIDRAMDDYDFTYNQDNERQAVEKDFVKLYMRHSKKLKGKELQNKLIDTLLKKGYNYEIIKEVITKGDYDNE